MLVSGRLAALGSVPVEVLTAHVCRERHGYGEVTKVTCGLRAVRWAGRTGWVAGLHERVAACAASSARLVMPSLVKM